MEKIHFFYVRSSYFVGVTIGLLVAEAYLCSSAYVNFGINFGYTVKEIYFKKKRRRKPVGEKSSNDRNRNDRKNKETNPEVLKLIKKALEGDKKAFEKLVLRYDSAISGYVKYKVWNEEDIKDIKQKGWNKAYTKLNKFDPLKGCFYTWLINCVFWEKVSIYIGYIQKRRKRVTNITDFEANQNCKENRPWVELIQPYKELPSGEKHGNPGKHEEVLNLAYQMLKIELLEGGPPNETLVYCCRKRLPEFGFKDGVSKIKKKYSNYPLSLLTQDIKKRYMKYFCMGDPPHYYKEEDIEKIFVELQTKLKKKVCELINPYTPIKKTGYSDELLNSPAEKTKLRDYHLSNISNWISRVEKRVKKRLKDLINPKNKVKGENQ
jgi:hypothetical protein